MKQCTEKCDVYSFIYLLLLVRSLEELFSLTVTWSIGQFHDCTGYLFCYWYICMLCFTISIQENSMFKNSIYIGNIA